MHTQTTDYGLDAPGFVRGVFLVGLAAVIVDLLLTHRILGRHAEAASSVNYALQIFGVLCLLFAFLLYASSRLGKFSARDRLIERLKLRGNETVLDLGCGRGLLLIAAAKQLPQGCAVGIDIWSQADQSANSREATLRNAVLEGVEQRVSVRDGDMCKLPFADGSFDAAVAHFAIHNVPTREGRRAAIREIVRALKRGGQVALSDVHPFVKSYADELRKSDMIDVEVSGLSFWTFPPARTVTARKPQQGV